jgi:hypothetical protein
MDKKLDLQHSLWHPRNDASRRALKAGVFIPSDLLIPPQHGFKVFTLTSLPQHGINHIPG